MTGKKQQRISLIFILLLITIVGTIVFLPKESQTAFLTGVGTLSISNIELTSPIGQLDGKVWVITVSPSQTNQRFYATTISPSTVESYTDDEKTKETAILEIDLDNQQCVYPLKEDLNAEKISTLGIYEWSAFGRCGTGFGTKAYYDTKVKEQGIDVNDIVYYGTWEDGADRCYVIYEKEEISVSKELEASYVRILGSAHLTVDGTTEDLNIDTEDAKSTATSEDSVSLSKSGYLGDRAFVEWRGNLINKNCDGLVNFRSMFRSNKWNIISDDKYDSYLRAKDIFYHDLMVVSKDDIQFGLEGNTYLTDESQTRGIYNELNVKINNAIAVQSVENGAVDGARFRVEHTDLLQSPVFTVYIEADYIGVESRLAEGRIISASDVEFDANSVGKIIVKVENTGTTSSSYTLKADCAAPFSSESKEIGIEAGDTETETLTVGVGSIDDPTTKKCTVGLASAGRVLDTKIVSATANPISTCLQDTFCSLEGGSYIVYSCVKGAVTKTDTCDATETCVVNQCVKKSEASTVEEELTGCGESYFSVFTDECDLCDSKIKEVESFSSYCAVKKVDVSLVSAILIGLGTSLILFLAIKIRYKPKKDLQVAVILASIVVGIVAGLFANVIIEHWIISITVGIIVLAVVVGIKSAIKVLIPI